MKIRRKKGSISEESWVFCCKRDGKDPWAVHEADMQQYSTGMMYVIPGIDGGWNISDFEVIPTSVTELNLIFKAGDTVFCKKGDPYEYQRFLGPRGHLVRLIKSYSDLGPTVTLLEVFDTRPENKPIYKIFKYTLPIAERTHIDLPLGAQILRVDGLDGGLWVWAMVDTTASLERREFALFKTGGDMPDNVAEEYKYVGCGSIYIQQELCLYVFEKL